MNIKFEKSKVIQPIFIVGCGRSGTTLLFETLSTHPEIRKTTGYPDGEDHDGWVKYGKCLMAGIGNVNHNSYHSGINGYHYCLHMTAEDATPDVVNAMHNYYWGDVLRHDPSKRVLNKQPHLSNKLDYLLGIFPDAKILHIVRDCESMVASWLAIMAEHPDLVAYWPGEERFPCFWLMPKPEDKIARASLARHPRFYPGGGAELWINYWCKVNLGIVEQMAGRMPQLFTLRYEDFVAQPTVMLEKISQFCSLKDYSFDTSHIVGGTAGKHKHLMSQMLRALIDDSALNVRAYFGY